MNIVRILIVSGWMMLSVSGSIRADLIPIEPLSEPIHKAHIIISGEILSKEVVEEMIPTGQMVPFTYFQMKVDEIIKGPHSIKGSVYIRQLGGNNLKTEDAAEFEIGEKSVVILEKENENGTYDIRGFFLGKLTVDPKTEKINGPLVEGDKQHAMREKKEPKKQWLMAELRKLAKE